MSEKENYIRPEEDRTAAAVKKGLSVILTGVSEIHRAAAILVPLMNQKYQLYEVVIPLCGGEDFDVRRQKAADDLAAAGLPLSWQEEKLRFPEASAQNTDDFRNCAIKAAVGEFLIFVTPDSLLKEESLQNAVADIRQRGADFMIGLPEDDPRRESLISPVSDGRANRYSGAWSRMEDVEGILFRRSFLLDHDIYFPEKSFFPERMFLIRCLMNSMEPVAATRRRICEHTEQILRPAESISRMTQERLEESRELFSKLLDEADSRIRQDENELDAEQGSNAWLEEHYYHMQFRSALVYSWLCDVLLRRFYAGIWSWGDDLWNVLSDLIRQSREQLLPSDENRLIAENKDLRLERDLMTKTQLIEEPILTVFLSGAADSGRVERLLTALYGQELPAFELLIDDGLQDCLPDWISDMENVRYLPHQQEWTRLHQDALQETKGTHILFMEEDLAPAKSILRKLYGMPGRKTMASAPVYRLQNDRVEAVGPSDAAFVNELVVVRLRSPFNRLDWMWGNKIFHVKTLRSRKILFLAGPDKDMNRLYNNSSISKLPERGFVTQMTDQQILKRAGARASLGYRGLLRKEEKRLERILRESTQIVTRQQKRKKKLQKLKNKVFKAASVKVFYPLQYQLARRKPLEKDKVIFVVPRHDYLPNSMEYIHDVIQKSGKYRIHIHYLNELKLRYRQQFKVNMRFLKDMGTAAYVFIDDYIPCLGGFNKRKETQVVQLWHGCGAFKKFGYSTADKIFGSSAAVQKHFRNYANHDVVTVSSPEVVWAYEEAMLMQGQNIVQPLGVSRTDVFFDPDYIAEARKRVTARIPAAAEKKVILYAPTFRGRVASAKGPSKLDLSLMYEHLGEEYIVLIKHHPFVKSLPEIAEPYRTFAFDVTHDLSIEDLICVSDICISDYSSLIFEYSLFGRPLILFAYDLEDYFDWRGFYYDYFEMAGGPVLYTTEEIVDYISDIEEKFDREKLTSFREKFMSSCDGHSTERILDYIGLQV